MFLNAHFLPKHYIKCFNTNFHCIHIKHFQNMMNIVKKKSLITEFYTLDGWIVWYINHISIKLLNNQISEMKNKREKLSQNVEDSNRSDKMKDKEATKS